MFWTFKFGLRCYLSFEYLPSKTVINGRGRGGTSSGLDKSCCMFKKNNKIYKQDNGQRSVNNNKKIKNNNLIA